MAASTSVRFGWCRRGRAARAAWYRRRDHPRNFLFAIPAWLHNEAAIRAHERVGFRRVGVMRFRERGQIGTWHDGLLMDMLADELTEETDPAYALSEDQRTRALMHPNRRLDSSGRPFARRIDPTDPKAHATAPSLVRGGGVSRSGIFSVSARSGATKSGLVSARCSRECSRL
jgi:hypothetical protein